MREAAALLEVPDWRVRQAVISGTVAARRGVGRRWLIDRDALLAWATSAPAARRRPERSDRYVSSDGRPHAELLAAVGLSDDEVAIALGVSSSRVHRWHDSGVPNLYVARLRALAGKDGSGLRS